MAKKILIIDDDPVTVHWLSARIKAGGYDVIAAFDGAKGLEAARQEKPDLILLDIMMPELNGYSVCGFVRTDCFLYATPIIMISACHGEHIQAFDEQFSPNAYISKPIDMEDVFGKIEELIA